MYITKMHYFQNFLFCWHLPFPIRFILNNSLDVFCEISDFVLWVTKMNFIADCMGVSEVLPAAFEYERGHCFYCSDAYVGRVEVLS